MPQAKFMPKEEIAFTITTKEEFPNKLNLLFLKKMIGRDEIFKCCCLL